VLGGVVGHRAERRSRRGSRRARFALARRSGDVALAAACYDLALLSFEGRGVPLDFTRARELFERACTGGDAAACHNFAVMLSDGAGGPNDRERATAMMRRACELGNRGSCESSLLR
jgi:TPR repeat protein